MIIDTQRHAHVYLGLLRLLFCFVFLVLLLFVGELHINPFTPRISYGDFKVILTSESVDEILSYNHSNETSLAVLSHGTIYI